MPPVKYDHQKIKSLEIPDSGTVDYWVEDYPGFGVRVSYKGSKSFFQKYRSPTEKDGVGNPKQQRYTIGKFPSVSLKDARIVRGRILDEVRDSKDPQKVKVDARKAAKDKALKLGPDPVTVQEGIARYVEEHVKVKNKPRYRADGTPYFEREKLFEKYVTPYIGAMRLDGIERKDVMAMHRRIVAAHSATQADRSIEALRAAFNWLYDKELAEDGLIFRFKSAKVKRDRILEHSEIQTLWKDLDTEHQPNKSKLFASISKLLILTGQRLNEVSGMRHRELDLDRRVWNLPPERTKNAKPHIVPISNAALAIIQDQKRIPGCDFVFTSTGKTPFTGYSRNKERLDRRLQFSADWRLHDLRRTFVTGMNDIGIPPHIVEAIVNHISGPSKGGVAGVYNRAQYWPERVGAMNRWADYLASIVGGTADLNVVPLRAGGE
jgi:integrase